MYVDAKSKTEDLKITHFFYTAEGLGLNELLLTLEKGTSPVAVSAMLKGLVEFYMTPAGIKDETPEEEVKQREANLANWAAASKKKNSKLILP
jgi:hypothetical protein